MHDYIILAAVVLPLIGVWTMEDGAFGYSVGVEGYPNGAFAAYALYAAVVLASYVVARRRRFLPGGDAAGAQEPFHAYARAVVVMLAAVLVVMLAGFDGWQVWAGDTAKGEFRAHLGSFGSIAYLLMNNVVPFAVALAAVLYRRLPKDGRNDVPLAALVLLTLLIGSTWGFKSTGITMLMPALVVLFWNASFADAVKIGTAFAVAIVVSFLVFDSETSEAGEGLSFLLTRLTTIQGDVSWYLWGEHAQGAEFPSYLKTLSAFIGDTLLTALTGIERDVPEVWAEYHFDLLVATLAGLPASILEEGHSIVGTPFADGLVLGGLPGVLLMALFAGLLAAGLSNMLQRALQAGQDYKAALLATYFGIYFVTFLRNGVVIQLFHVATVVGLLVAYVVGSGLHRLVTGRQDGRVAA